MGHRAADDHLYATLGVPRSASAEEIRAAYYALVARYHPDKYSGNPLQELAGEKMAHINHAYEVLSDPERRAQYDAGRTPDPMRPYQPSAARPSAAWKRSALTLLGAVLVLLIGVRVLATLLRAMRGTPLPILVLAVVVGAAAWWLRRRRARRPPRP